jgi:hypothetical protein
MSFCHSNVISLYKIVDIIIADSTNTVLSSDRRGTMYQLAIWVEFFVGGITKKSSCFFAGVFSHPISHLIRTIGTLRIQEHLYIPIETNIL